MRFSKWHAAGNVYLLTEELIEAERVPGLAAGTDGIIEIRGRGEAWVEIAVWNPDGSRAEMSGNGTRIAARWLADQTPATEISIRVGPREIVARLVDGELEQ